MTGYQSKKAMARDKLIELAKEGMGMHSPDAPEYIVCEALIEALAQPEQEPVAWKHPDKNMVFWEDTKEVDEYHGFKPTIPLYPHPQRTEQNFCSRCGKRTKDIHTCTPPMEKNI